MSKMFYGAAFALLCLTCGAVHADGNEEIVRQGDAAVTLSDVEGFLQQMPEDRRLGYLGSPRRVQQMLVGILRDKQLAHQAETMKLDQNPDIQAEIAYSRNQILAKARLDAFVAGLKIPSMEAAAKEQYLAHKVDYATPENVDVKHVLISTKNRTDAEARELADKVHAEAVANPADFDNLIQKYSEDPSKSSNIGMIRGATSNRMAREFAAAAKNLNTVGEISPPVKTMFGYHILKLLDKQPAKQQDYDAVKAQLIAKLKSDYVAEQRDAFVAKLDQSTPNVNPQGIQAFQQRYKLDEVPSLSEAIKAAQSGVANK
ncbi:MAG: peptidylprolyl isomerase [Rudaea sp.]|uniref:peptidylprolyl isomerase n=1 Tax=Rudaea sp. TaxID=2136325 RepID=UPI0039E258D4